ncbi:MAG TPA: response regulator [Xanthobacteraceae bacterium]|nr:response regulator [Xanthobacteraceae bacterium]
MVDDKASVRDALAEMLRVFGYTVATYAAAESFFQSLDAERSGCVVADIRMPGMDGIELVRELSRRGIALPVIAVSGHADMPMVVAAIKAGAEDFIAKPVDDHQLVAAINRGLARHGDVHRQQDTMQDLHMRFTRLTPQEVEVLDLVVQGLTSTAISVTLGISLGIVESYRTQVMEKMQAASVAALVRSVIRLGRL